jgi:sugar-specific transcriptional regulator TrmB
MNIEQIRDDIADELGEVYEIITKILESFPDDEPEHKAIICNDNAMALLEHAIDHAEKAFKCLDRLERSELEIPTQFHRKIH